MVASWFEVNSANSWWLCVLKDTPQKRNFAYLISMLLQQQSKVNRASSRLAIVMKTRSFS